MAQTLHGYLRMRSRAPRPALLSTPASYVQQFFFNLANDALGLVIILKLPKHLKYVGDNEMNKN